MKNRFAAIKHDLEGSSGLVKLIVIDEIHRYGSATSKCTERILGKPWWGDLWPLACMSTCYYSA